MAVAAAIAAAVAAAAGIYSQSVQSDAQKKAGSAAGVGHMGASSSYTPTAGSVPGGGQGQSVRQMLGFDDQRRNVGDNQGTSPIPPAKGFSAGGAPPAMSPQVPPAPAQSGATGLAAIPQGRTFNDLYNQQPTQAPPSNLPGGYAQDLYHSGIGQSLSPQQEQAQPSQAGQYAQYAQLAGQLGQAFRPMGVSSAGIPHANGGGYQPTAGQFLRRPTY